MLNFAEGLDLPVDAVTQTFAFLGRKGAGKTYASGRFVEGLLDVGAQVIVLDTVGNWYGLRLSADGKNRGYNVPVLGGQQGDIPLEKTGGALVADVLVDTTTSMVLDLTLFSQGALYQFMTDFAERFFERKKTERLPVHLVIEEAQRLIPQRTQHGGLLPRLKGAMEQIIRLGRNYGIGISMLTQRPQSVDKEVLNQTECLCAFQMTGPHERKAIREWIVDKGLDLNLLDELPSLPVGTAFVWSPQWLDVLGKFKVLRKRTFDASSTPKLGEQRVPPRALDAAALNQLRQAMAESIKKSEENDPRVLKRKIGELERQVGKLRTHAPEPKEVRVEVPMLQDGERALLSNLGVPLEALGNQLGEVRTLLENVKTRAAARPAATVRVVQTTQPVPALRPAQQPAGDDNVKLIDKQRTMLAALAASSEGKLSRRQLAVQDGMSHSSGSFNKYIGSLSRQGLVEASGGGVTITDKGRAQATTNVVAQTPGEILALWLPKLRGKQRDILQLLFDAPDRQFTRAEVAEAVGMSVASGSFNKYIGGLSGLDLIVAKNGVVQINHHVFGL